MATLSYSEITPKKIITFSGEPYEVLSSHVFRMQQRKPVNQTKLKHLVSGKVVENAFHQNESAEEADIETMPATYLYTNRGESWFAETDKPKNRFSFPDEAVHGQVQWLSQNAPVEVVTYEEKPIAIRIPVKVDIEVSEAPPNLKGDTSGGGNKLVELTTGATVNTPLFINTGDIIRVNTDSGEYVERVEKA